MAVYRIKRKAPNPPDAPAPERKPDPIPADGAPDQSGSTEQPPADRGSGRTEISRSKNRSLDAYVGSGKSARKMKENGGSMVDAIYNRREKATETSNETDRMLLEAFSDDKTLKKELKRQEKLKKKEEKRRRKLIKKGILDERRDEDDFLMGVDSYADSLDAIDGAGGEDDGSAPDALELLYTSEELKSAARFPEPPSAPAEAPGPEESNPYAEFLAPEDPHTDGAVDAAETPDARPDAADEGKEASVVPPSPDDVFTPPFSDEITAREQTDGATGESAPAPEEAGTAREYTEQDVQDYTEPQDHIEQTAENTEQTEDTTPAPQDGPVLSADAKAEADAPTVSPETPDDAVAPDAPDAAEPSADEGSETSPEPSQADPGMAATREFSFTGMNADEIRKILEHEGLAAPEEFAQDDEFEDVTGSADLYDDSDQDGADELLHAAKRAKQPEEFTDPDLAEEMTEGIKNSSAKTLACAVWSFLVMALALWLDSACFTSIPHPAFLTTGKYGAVLILVDLQLLLVSGLLIWPGFISGFKSLFSGKADADSVTSLAMTAAAIYEISLLFTSASDPGIMLFSSAGCLFGFLNSLGRYLDERRLYRSFRVAASKKTKFVARRLGTDSSEFEALREHLPEDPDIFTVEKTKFVTGFMSGSRKPSKASSAYNAAVWIVLALAVIFGVYNLSGGTAQAFKAFTLICLFGFPACGIFALSVPLSKMSRRCAADESAVIGASAIDEYSGASVISFNDTELFPANRIRVTSIRTYGETRIDRGILYAAMIFKKVGGPLSKVFAKSIASVYPDVPSDFDVLENTGDGICAKIDGKEVFVGNKDYMLSYDFGYVNEEIDEAFENSVGRIMYMAVGDRIAAKFYIRYAFNPKFERVMRALYRTGTCVSVKTCDPNIDDELISAMMRKRSYPVGVLKTSGASLETPVSDSAESGLICTSSIMNMLRAFIFCAKAKKLISVNILVKFISLFVGVFAAAALCLFGRMNSITTLFVMVYQLMWVMAVIVPSAAD